MVFRRDKGVMGQDFLKNPGAPPWVPVLPWGPLLQSLGEASACAIYRPWEPTTLVYGLCVEVLRKYLRKDEFMLKAVVPSCYWPVGSGLTTAGSVIAQYAGCHMVTRASVVCPGLPKAWVPDLGHQSPLSCVRGGVPL